MKTISLNDLQQIDITIRPQDYTNSEPTKFLCSVHYPLERKI